MAKKPRVNEKGANELRKADDQFQELQQDFKETINSAIERKISIPECVPDHDARQSMSVRNSQDVPVLKPLKSISDKAKFNEKYRKDWERGWEYVKAIVQNYEIIGESVECWTHKFAGDPAHFWRVPVNKALMMPRLLAEQLAECKYHRIVMDEKCHTASDGLTFFGAVQAVEVRQRIGAQIIPDTKTVAVGF